MMDSLRSATQNTMFEQWLDATMKPALEPKQDRLHQQQVLHLLRHMHVLQDTAAVAIAGAAAVQPYALAYTCVGITLWHVVFSWASVLMLAEQSNKA